MGLLQNSIIKNNYKFAPVLKMFVFSLKNIEILIF